MIYFFHISACLCLVIFQTTILPCFPLFNTFYDLSALYIVYMGLFFGVREGMPVALIIGLIMDSLSGGPFGVYLTTYLWLFIGVRQFIKFFRVSNYILLPFVVTAAVLIENVILFGTFAMLEPGTQFSSSVINSVVIQVAWAICTGPFIIQFYNFTYKRWDKLFNKLVAVFSHKQSPEINRQ
ncbi:MAG: rod shape-determining protein MreD [Desulfobacteraceae bacterium]|nr:rod shape-determining protein MreD [Pseudomonadota bacterium]MBU4464099.1 rod shape-determining protein MreD [Pseudomonadota bacterium]MCG2754728.1 rod shape-determining protein MreD [Desulfobacteraceae bacterium]